MALAYQVQFLEPLSEPLNLLGVEVGGHADLVARLVAHLHGESNFRICKKSWNELLLFWCLWRWLQVPRRTQTGVSPFNQPSCWAKPETDASYRELEMKWGRARTQGPSPKGEKLDELFYKARDKARPKMPVKKRAWWNEVGGNPELKLLELKKWARSNSTSTKNKTELFQRLETQIRNGFRDWATTIASWAQNCHFEDSWASILFSASPCLRVRAWSFGPLKKAQA